MSRCATHIDQHDCVVGVSLVITAKAVCDSFLEREKVQPIGASFSLGGHPEVEVVQGFRVFGEPLEQSVGCVKAVVEWTLRRALGVLIVVLSEEGGHGDGG